MTPPEGGIEIRTIRSFLLWHVFHHLTRRVRLPITPRHGGDRIFDDSSFCSMACFSPCDSWSTGFFHMTSLKGGG